MSKAAIHFKYEGKNYVVAGEAYNTNLIKLPDGTILKVAMWLESDPPEPGIIEDITSKYIPAQEE